MKTAFITLVTPIVLLLTAMAPVTHAATITVTSTANSGAGTLRNALASAANGDTINFAVTGNILLTTGELLVSNSVTIAGPGPATLALDGNFPNTTNRVFHMTNSTVSVSGLTITNGHIISSTLPFPGNSAGGIYNDHSTLTLSNCILTGNAANLGSGGGIVNDGQSGSATLTVSNCTFTGNSALGGGGIYNDGLSGSATLRVIASSFSSNSAGSSVGIGIGGGLYNDGFAGSATGTVIATTFAGNSVGNQGGGIYNNRAVLTVSNCALSGNSSSTDGGGHYNNNGTVAFVTSTLSGNSARRFGGGIFNNAASQTITGTVTLTACTLSGNSATNNGGGAIHNSGVIGSAILKIGDTILNTGASGSNIVNSSGVVTSLGYNLSSDNAAGALTNTADQINTDPLLAPLANNGGPTPTHALLPGSPAIDQGKSFGLTTDQRGLPRPLDDPCLANAAGGDGSDIGAFEVQEVCANFQITAITRETSNIRITWTTYTGKTNALQWTAGAGDGSYQTSSFANLFTITNTVGTATNYLDVGGATNQPARYYRVRLVP